MPQQSGGDKVLYTPAAAARYDYLDLFMRTMPPRCAHDIDLYAGAVMRVESALSLSLRLLGLLQQGSTELLFILWSSPMQRDQFYKFPIYKDSTFCCTSNEPHITFFLLIFLTFLLESILAGIRLEGLVGDFSNPILLMLSSINTIVLLTLLTFLFCN